jgi:toxin ParE1/3/4
MRKVRLSKLANRDLREIYKYSARQFGVAQAETYYAGLWRCFRFLAEHPAVGRLRTELTPPARSHHYKRHVMFYDIAEDHILVVRVLHERMDVARHMRGLGGG